ncbi:Reticulocyte-binding protein 2 a [Orchesella cincta]|uniref:Reticulocyte-binding protein 2 a n=1 Tax=Orchesella cincta TaxID=48709 RepID=A0A1D2N995_ORCCI|nr:Reticulocyte-binding protein 2 a [Orchesella cincta]
MGGNQSTQKDEQAIRQRAEVEAEQQRRRIADEGLRRKQELETQEQIRLLEENRRKEKEDQEQKERQAELEERKRQDDQERAARLDDHQHEQEMLKIQGTEKDNQRKDDLSGKQIELEHTRLMDSQAKIFDILKDTFSKVQTTSMSEAAYGACILQSIQAGQPVDKDVLLAVTSKVPTPPAADIDRIVDRMIRQTCEEDEDGFVGHGPSDVLVPSGDPEF